ncbi:MAG: hypothetical protein ABI579_00150 [Candidatus Sumerlaeota bacterium]
MSDFYTFTHSMDFSVPVKAAFDYFTDPESIARMAPASLNVRVKKVELPLHAGSKILFGARPRMVPLEMNWLFEITEFVSNELFCDTLLKGPVEHWVHRQQFKALSKKTCRVVDSVEFSHPTGIIGAFVPAATIKSGIGDVFVKREKLVRLALEKKSA